MFILGISLGILIGVIICYIPNIELFNNDNTNDTKIIDILKTDIEMQRHMFEWQQKQDEPKREACLNSLDKIRKD